MLFRSRTAMGKMVDLDALQLANEGVIAVGNMKTNARGDELGPGGKVVKTRAQLMQEYHKLNSAPVAEDIDFEPERRTEVPQPPVNVKPTGKMSQKVAEDAPLEAEPTYTKPRGSFAEAVASETEVSTELLDPKPLLGSNKPTGVQRI